MVEIVWTVIASLLAVPLFVLFIMSCYATWTGVPVECEISVPWSDKAIVIRAKGFK